MSWHHSVGGKDSDELFKNLNEVEITHDQEAEARVLVREAVLSGQLGDGPYKVVISGHKKQADSDPNGNSLSITIHSKS